MLMLKVESRERRPSLSNFRKLASALGWRPTELIAMLWAYFDESGEHDPHTGHLKRLTVGGWLASYETWEYFDSEWRSALDRAGLMMFHMTDFERYRGEFAGWSQEKHKNVLNELLEIIGNNIKAGFGFTNQVIVEKPSHFFTDTYENNLIDCLMHMANDSAYGQKDNISVMFAKHSDYREPRIKRIFDFMNFGDARLGELVVGDPSRQPPLQAADILAYELQQLHRGGLTVRRYPLRRLWELGCRLYISTAETSPWVHEILAE